MGPIIFISNTNMHYIENSWTHGAYFFVKLIVRTIGRELIIGPVRTG